MWPFLVYYIYLASMLQYLVFGLPLMISLLRTVNIKLLISDSNFENRMLRQNIWLIKMKLVHRGF